MAEMVLEQSINLGDYLALLKRRARRISLITAVVFIIGVIIAYTLPPVYESKSTILIEEQEIPTDLVRTTVTSYAGQRIQVISQRVMTRNNLLKTIDKYDLYAEERKHETTEEIIEQMREDILINMITANVVDPRSGKPTAATIAFTVGFTGENPGVVQKVATELTTLYLNENLKTRAEKTEETSEFLEAEAKRLKDEIERMDDEMAAFNEEYMGNLPESRSITNSLLLSVKQEIDSIDDQLRSSEETRQYLEAQLAQLEPYEASDDGKELGPAARLYNLRNSLLALKTRYSDSHPDVIATKRNIAALEAELGLEGEPADQSSQLEMLRQQLATLQQTYSDEHPDVKNLKLQIAALEQEMQNSNPRKQANPASMPPPTNEAYIALSSQIKRLDLASKLARERQQKLWNKKAEYEQRLQELPVIEGKYRAMTRDYANATARYRELKAKQMTADVAMEMEKKRKGEKFTLIDPAIVPSKPVSPNRPAIVIISLVLALGSGIGSAFAYESLNPAVRGTKGVMAILKSAPLAVIPYLDTHAEITRKKRRFRILVVSAIIGFAIVLLLIHFLYSPLDVLYLRGLRKFDTIFGD